jgi:hypothetical protein
LDVERVAQCSGVVTQRNVETLIGRLATDAVLRRRFAEDPSAILHELQVAGFELTAVELDALAATDAEALRALAQSIDRRIRKAHTHGGPS